MIRAFVMATSCAAATLASDSTATATPVVTRLICMVVTYLRLNDLPAACCPLPASSRADGYFLDPLRRLRLAWLAARSHRHRHVGERVDGLDPRRHAREDDV